MPDDPKIAEGVRCVLRLLPNDPMEWRPILEQLLKERKEALLKQQSTHH
jgi:hypothetical protein